MLYRVAFAVVMFVVSVAAQAATQLIIPSPTASTLTPGSPIAVQVNYTTVGPVDSTLQGVAFRMHWDSTRLAFQNLAGVLPTNLILQSAPIADDDNFDNDLSTDFYVIVEWNDAAGNWPGGTLPVAVFTANFITAGGFSSGATQIRFSERTTAPGFTFASAPVSVTAQPIPDTTVPFITLRARTPSDPVGRFLNPNPQANPSVVTIVQGTPFVDALATVTDQQDGDISSRLIVSGFVNSNVAGDYVLSYNATDLSGNAAPTVSRTVHVLAADKTAPVVTPPASIVVEATGPLGVLTNTPAIAAFLSGGTALDNRYGVLQVTNDEALASIPLGTQSVTFRATDLEGNVGTALSAITVQDTTPPTLSGNVSITVPAIDATGIPAADARIQAALAAVRAVDIVAGVVSVSNNAPVQFPLGATTVTFSAADSQDNGAQVTLVVNVTDQGAPTVTPPATITVEATSAAGTPATNSAIAAFLSGATANDPVDGSLPANPVNPPTQFPIGTTTITFAAQDRAGNRTTATSNVTVADTTPPTITPPVALTVVETGSGRINASAVALQTFLNGASAADIVDGAITVSNNAPATFPVGTTLVTFSATDAAGNTGTATANVTVLAATGADTDGDGMPDNFEVANALNPNDPADASLDPDGDGFTNLQEFQNGTNPRVDNTVPVVTAPADIVVNAVGPLTAVTLGTATATDQKDGTLPVAISAPQLSPFPPGRYVVTYTATDPANNVGTAQQIVTVVPLIELSEPQTVSAGQTVMLDVVLNGVAGTYPVTANFTVSGSAVSPGDHDLVNGSVSIASGRLGQILFHTTTAGGGKTVIITLANPTNANVGPVAQSTVTIAANNAPPVVNIGVKQGTTLGSRVVTTGGNVVATAVVSDPNANDTQTFAWTADSGIPSTNGTTAPTYVFDPTNVAAGFYKLSVRVTDGAGASTTQALLLQVSTSAPTLSTTADANGNGVVDSVDGAGDNNGNGLPNFVDPITDLTLLPSAGAANGFLLSTEPGARLAIGQTAFAANANGARIALADITAHGGASGGTATTTDAAFAYDLPFYDFAVDGLIPGGKASVVIPLPSAIPSGTLSYRKFTPAAGFTTFVSNGGNSVSSAPGQLGICPAAGAAPYVAGLTQGHFCVQLTITDGGPNDADGAANGRIVDPGSIGRALPAPPPPPPPPATSSSHGGGGGCAVGSGPADPTLPLLGLGAAVYVLRRRGWRIRLARPGWLGRI